MTGTGLPPGWQPAPPAAWPALGSGPLAIVFMLHTPGLTERESHALETLRRHGEDHPRFLLVPEGMRIGFAHEDFRVVPLPARNFASRAAYNAMMLTPLPYRLFAGYRQMLIYQTDCLMLRTGVGAWAARGFSYVGPPWFSHGWFRSGLRARPQIVGNGGFSLRAPADALAVLEGRLDPARLAALPHLWRHFARKTHALVLMRQARQGRAAADYLRDFPRPEDEFWSCHAPLFHPGWRVPTPHEALDFAFELQPRRAWRLAGQRLPVGAHAWWKADEAFWRDILAKQR
jgi:hypothetical protein